MGGRFLQEKGYRLLDANYRCRCGEVDIVAQEGDELVCVESEPGAAPSMALLRNLSLRPSLGG